jgi:16S rRNA (guanine527-N7)-methyltransferase
VLDSAQLAEHLPAGARRLVDLGSGAGFPGLVLAILGVPAVDLIESDRRKAAFLREAARELGLGGVTVHAERIERVMPFPTDIVTARALAPLPRLLELARPFVAPRTRCLFLKGRGAAAELTAARAAWTMRAAVVPSRTATDGVLLILDEVQRAERRSASEPHPDPGARQPEGRGR